MMDKRLHRIVFGPDQVTGSYRMACGRVGWPLGMGEFDGNGETWRATAGVLNVTCGRCKIRLRGDQAKVVRALLDLGGRAKLLKANRFDFAPAPPRIFCRSATCTALARLQLIKRSSKTEWRLMPFGVSIARTLEAFYPLKEVF